ncbi:MAG: Rne/Rng family ribonuclease [Deltaproteobacteria bacterium]|jgi:ribonuclease G
MSARIVINRAPGEARVAFLRDGVLEEIYIERDHHLGVVGNVYRGKVTRVLPGMQAAFVEIGLGRAAFLYVDDIVTEEDLARDAAEDIENSVDVPPPRERPPIEKLLSEGQQIVVQVAKAPLGTKGARVTGYVTIPGRYVVYMPTIQKVGVSRKITQDAERKRLRELVESLRQPEDGGFIVRTVCEGLDSDTIAKDMEFVRSLWREVEEAARTQPVPALLLADLDLVLRATRDLFNDDVEALVVDSAEQGERIKRLLNRSAPHLSERVEIYEEPEPIFDRFGLEVEVERALLREITLPSGAAIVVDEAEALTAIDVNTASFVGSKDLEATLLKTNLEAAKAIAAQIRLRNLGGIIIVDFIDMQLPESREKVFSCFVEEIEKDRAKTHVSTMSDFGLIEMTRKRVRPSLGKALTEPCPYCDGRGRIRSKATLCQDILREIKRQAQLHPDGQILVSAMPEVAARLWEDTSKRLVKLEEQLGRNIVVEARRDLHQESYEVLVRTTSTIP